MKLKSLEQKYAQLQQQYGASELDSIYGGGCKDNPNICFVFMNPTRRNIASSKDWTGIKVPWIGTKNVWDLFYKLGLLDNRLYKKIRVRNWNKRIIQYTIYSR